MRRSRSLRACPKQTNVERSQGAPQSNTKCMQQGKGQVKKNSAKHENNEKAGKKVDDARPKT